MQTNLFKRTLPLPIFEEDYRGIVTKFLNDILVAVISLMTILLVIRLATGRLSIGRTELTLVGIIVFDIFLFIALRHGYVLPSSVAFILSTWMAITYQVWRADGVYDVAVVAYIVIIVMSSVFTNWRVQIFITAISLLSIWGLALYHPNSLFMHVDLARDLARDLTIFFTLTGFLTVFLVRALSKSMDQTRDELKERKQVEARLRSIVENTADIILEIDRSGQILYANRYSDRYIGLNVRDVLPLDQHQQAEEAISNVFKTQKSLAVELQTIAPNGNITWDLIRLGPIMTGNEVTSLAIIVTEITERKLFEQERESLITELEARNAELTQFAYTVSHELKTPIVTMKGFVGSIGHDLKNKKYERVEKDLSRVSTSIDKLHNTLSDLLELSRIGRMVNLPKNIPLGDIIEDALEIVQGQIEKYKVTVQIQPHLPTVRGDRQRLTEVLQNLLDNAAKYMGDQPNPLIEIGQNGEADGHPVFFVKDNGIGIAPEYHERIFGLFNKLDAKSEGTGVGLALVKRIIEFHGGRIWIESEGGRGSTFYFTLPSNITGK